ncbi:MAG: RNA pseudouridine synthase [Kiloniellales bacterium]
MISKRQRQQEVAARRAPDKPGLAQEALLYRDSLLLVVNKPAGLPVHGGPSGKPSLEDLLPELRFGYRETPRLAHRLDQETSGCLALGRNDRAMRKLGRLFQRRLVQKRYWAVVAGSPPDVEGTIDLPLAKTTEGRKWRMAVDDQGKAALTLYRVLGQAAGMTWLELSPKTGRTHQIRVHLAALGCPILGDLAYGGDPGVMQLHAVALTLPLYDDRPPVTVTAPPPTAQHRLLHACGWRPVRAADVDSAERIAQEETSPACNAPTVGTGKS